MDFPHDVKTQPGEIGPPNERCWASQTASGLSRKHLTQCKAPSAWLFGGYPPQFAPEHRPKRAPKRKGTRIPTESIFRDKMAVSFREGRFWRRFWEPLQPNDRHVQVLVACQTPQTFLTRDFQHLRCKKLLPLKLFLIWIDFLKNPSL